MLKVQCPNCGASILFRAGETVFAVCSFCQTAMVRSDVTVESIGKVAILQDSWSPLQLGTEGDFDGGHFFVVGRVQYRWENGTWSEWYTSFNDGRKGWMTEAQGFFALTFAVQPAEELPTWEALSTGRTIKLDGKVYEVQDIKSVELDFSQGELPFKALPGRKSTTIDLTEVAKATGRSVGFASLEYSDEGVLVFAGRYEEFDSLNFQNLRVIDGW